MPPEDSTLKRKAPEDVEGHNKTDASTAALPSSAPFSLLNANMYSSSLTEDAADQNLLRNVLEGEIRQDVTEGESQVQSRQETPTSQSEMKGQEGNKDKTSEEETPQSHPTGNGEAREGEKKNEICQAEIPQSHPQGSVVGDESRNENENENEDVQEQILQSPSDSYVSYGNRISSAEIPQSQLYGNAEGREGQDKRKVIPAATATSSQGISSQEDTTMMDVQSGENAASAQIPVSADRLPTSPEPEDQSGFQNTFTKLESPSPPPLPNRRCPAYRPNKRVWAVAGTSYTAGPASNEDHTIPHIPLESVGRGTY